MIYRVLFLQRYGSEDAGFADEVVHYRVVGGVRNTCLDLLVKSNAKLDAFKRI
jgi:hypothetical protein